ncbi:unnamed protein product [Enterobius vermicularis]|uniref:Gem-associated protein 2 n=1 Tax=Enterobius vermicularis TaxID=51028 RepID=A0A0N4V176_ENTVE|nr:unnamed protein product [Enterobius vermicularis]
MEQEAVFDLGEFDEKMIDMNEAPRSAIHYLQQTAVQRSRCAAVVCVKEGLAGPAKPSSFSRSFAGDSPITVVGLPSEEWCKAKCSLFSEYRSEIESKRSSCPEVQDVVFPAPADYKQWIKFCGLKRERVNNQSDRSVSAITVTEKRRTPTVPIILSLSENRVNHLVEHLTRYFVENGYSRELFEWFYAVLLVLQCPPPSDECSAIREFAKHAKFLRSTLNESDILDNSIVYELTLFVAIISIYFEQKDLADYPQVDPVVIS